MSKFMRIGPGAVVGKEGQVQGFGDVVQAREKDDE